MIRNKKELNQHQRDQLKNVQKYYIDSICDILDCKQYTVTDNNYTFQYSMKPPIMMYFFEIVIFVDNYFERE